MTHSALALAFAAAATVFALPKAQAADPAGDDWLVLTVGSRHSSRGYNEHNWGLGIEHGFNDNWRGVFGTYRNSYYRQTVYVGAMYQPWRVLGWRVGGATFLASGYDRRPVLIPFPSLSYEQKDWGLNLGPILPTVVGFQVKFRY